MRFIGKWLIWIGGLALIYVDLRPLVEETLRAYRAGRSIGVPVQDWLLEFARPVFILGVMCAAALPELGKRREKKRPVGTPSVPVTAPSLAIPAVPPPAASPEKL